MSFSWRIIQMTSLSKKWVVDTNVPVTANMALKPDEIPNELLKCVWACVETIDQVQKNGILVLDEGDEIFTEYRKNLSMRGQPGVGDRFMKWLHDNRWKFPASDRVAITKDGNSYKEFPDHEALINFDNSDRKFVAVSNAHREKPAIIQATDSKWWGWKEALAEVGITVLFLCPKYAEAKHREKIST